MKQKYRSQEAIREISGNFIKLKHNLSYWKWKLLSHVQFFADQMDCSLPSFPIHGILQASILEWVAVPFSRGSSQPRDRTQSSYIVDQFFTIWATREAQEYWSG